MPVAGLVGFHRDDGLGAAAPQPGAVGGGGVRLVRHGTAGPGRGPAPPAAGNADLVHQRDAANVEFADAFDARIFIPRADQQWVQRPSPRIDDEAEPVRGLTLARIGGHFDGASVLHWPAGSEGRGALPTGDTITVVPDRDWVSFMWSYPNL